MGLEARVYTSAERLASTVDLALTTTDAETGEVISDFSGPFIAIQRRLGNASMIAWLSEQVAPALASISESIILGKVLYSGTHSGDMIYGSDFPQLLREIEIVRQRFRDCPSTEVEEFLNNLKDLIVVAQGQCNPIVFV
jgi:hypothetical protein